MYLQSIKLSAIDLFETNLNVTDDVKIERLCCFIEMLQINMDQGYGHELWAVKGPRDTYLVETVKPCDSDAHYSTKRHCKLNSFKDIFKGYLRTTSNNFFRWGNLSEASFT